ncbi:MAG: hypothetical protein EOM22_05285 [Gammaproteobacteria bacterium]|nr:hypothetical protein [Gammaproteobacteria bacterium]
MGKGWFFAIPLLGALGALVPAALPAVPGNAVADCAETDVKDFDALQRCMASARFGGGTGQNIFLSGGLTACADYRQSYELALTASGIRRPPTRQEKPEAYPSCEMIALVLTEFQGEAPFWTPCMGYERDEEGTGEHFRQCMTWMLPRYTSGKTLDRLGDCKEALRYYEIALRSATKNQTLPANYQPPDCAVVAGVIAAFGGKQPTWTNCLDFDPQKVPEHAAQCLEDYIGRLETCDQVRNAYENSLKEAYGGRFPSGYTLLTCDQAKLVLSREKERKELSRQVRTPATACPYQPASKPIQLYEPRSKNFMQAPAKCGPYFVYIDRCVNSSFRSAFGTYTVSKTPPDELTDTIVEAWTWRNDIAKRNKVISEERKIGANQLRYVTFAGHLGNYYGDDPCLPYKPDLLPRPDALLKLIQKFKQ